jgi:hypothetical protein
MNVLKCPLVICVKAEMKINVLETSSVSIVMADINIASFQNSNLMQMGKILAKIQLV